MISETRAIEMSRSLLTLSQAAHDFHARVIKPVNDPTYAASWISTLEHHVPPAIWNKRINDVSAPELLRALHGIRARKSAIYLPAGPTIPMTRRKVRAYLDRVFDDAVFYGRCLSNPAAAVLRKLGEGSPRFVRGHYPALPYQSAPLLYAKLKATDGVVARCLEFSWLTASRMGESTVATWPEFKLEEGIWVVPAGRMKGRKQHTVFLSDRAVEIVRSQRGIDSTFVFSSINSRSDSPKPVSGGSLRHLLRRLDAKEKSTVHALCRATFSTWAYDKTDHRSDVIEACLSHGELYRVRTAYNRSDFQESRRELLRAWNGFLDPDGAANVYQLGAATGERLQLVSSQARAQPPRRYLRLRDVMVRTGFCPASIYQRVSVGKFPRPQRFGRMNGWLDSDVDEWLAVRRAEVAAKARGT